MFEKRSDVIACGAAYGLFLYGILSLCLVLESTLTTAFSAMFALGVAGCIFVAVLIGPDGENRYVFAAMIFLGCIAAGLSSKFGSGNEVWNGALFGMGFACLFVTYLTYRAISNRRTRENEELKRKINLLEWKNS